jgi:hypothetical protein
MKYEDLPYQEKLACISLFPEKAKKDKDWKIRLSAYRALGFDEDAKKDEHRQIRLEAYISLGFNEASKKDKYCDIRLLAYRALGFDEAAKKDEYPYIKREAIAYFKIRAKLFKEITITLTQDKLDQIKKAGLL